MVKHHTIVEQDKNIMHSKFKKKLTIAERYQNIKVLTKFYAFNKNIYYKRIYVVLDMTRLSYKQKLRKTNYDKLKVGSQKQSK